MPKKMRQASRGLRKNPTEAEQKIWRRLRNRGLGAKFRRQHPLGPFVLDFFCEDARLCVELDGGQHAKDGQADSDAARSEWLASQGIRLLRFWNSDVMDNVESVLEMIRSALTLPSPGGGAREGDGEK